MFCLTIVDDSSLDKNDPRRWLTADKETLQRRLSLIEAKNDVKCIANKFRREHGHEINPREIVATLAQRVRMERSDKESRLIVKEFVAQKTRNKLPKGSTVSHDSFMATCDELPRDNCTKELFAPFLENCAIDQLRKSQRKFFSRPRSRTQVRLPADVVFFFSESLTASSSGVCDPSVFLGARRRTNLEDGDEVRGAHSSKGGWDGVGNLQGHMHAERNTAKIGTQLTHTCLIYRIPAHTHQ